LAAPPTIYVPKSQENPDRQAGPLQTRHQYQSKSCINQMKQILAHEILAVQMIIASNQKRVDELALRQTIRIIEAGTEATRRAVGH
jgi:hypothetical protein